MVVVEIQTADRNYVIRTGKYTPFDVLSVESSVSANQETPLMPCGDNRETHVRLMTLARRKILRKEGSRDGKETRILFCCR